MIKRLCTRWVLTLMASIFKLFLGKGKKNEKESMLIVLNGPGPLVGDQVDIVCLYPAGKTEIMDEICWEASAL